MSGGEECFRTLTLAPVTDVVLNVPNAGRKIEPCFEKLRISYSPAFDGFGLSPEDGMLHMTVGGRRMHKLSAAFACVEKGGGDFGIRTSDDRKADYWMFWWMPDLNYHLENRK